MSDGWRSDSSHSDVGQNRLDDMIVQQIRGRGITCSRTLEAMKSVPRHHFVLDQAQSMAYDDTPLAIGHGQTISQPYMVALMSSQFGELPHGSRILEVGSGCGYQTAILIAMGFEVISIEIVGDLVKMAKINLSKLNMQNASFHIRDGKSGFSSRMPYAGILAAACASQLPQAWLDQLGEGGILIAPVEQDSSQFLMKIEKRNGKIIQTRLCEVRFVPLV